MTDLAVRNDRPIPASYWVAASIGSLIIGVSYATTALWAPYFVRQWSVTVSPEFFNFGPGFFALFDLAIGIVMAATPWLALRWPGIAITLAVLPVVPIVMHPDGDQLHFGVFASLCAIAVTAAWRHPRTAAGAAVLAELVIVGWLISGGVMAAPFGATVSLRYGAGDRPLLGVVYTVAVVLVGLAAWRLRVSGQRELERRSLVSRSHQVEEQAAVVGERARLARDLHDVVAHHVSLIAVRAETAPYTHPEIEDEARVVLADIAADARLALDELRGVLGILGRSGAAERAPQPTWSDIAALAERTRSAGVDIDVSGEVSADVGPSSGYVAYRVVQEALTNARKHAPGAPVSVDLAATSQLLTVNVSTPLGAVAATSSGGQGLVGMRERVEALGGRLQAGSVDGRFVVEAILPRAAG
jgi:signal transduction histidine kinase